MPKEGDVLALCPKLLSLNWQMSSVSARSPGGKDLVR